MLIDGVQHEAYPEVIAHDHHHLDRALTPEMAHHLFHSSLVTRCSRNSARPKVITVASLSESSATFLLYFIGKVVRKENENPGSGIRMFGSPAWIRTAVHGSRPETISARLFSRSSVGVFKDLQTPF